MSDIGNFLRDYRDEFTIRIELGSVYEKAPSEVFEVRHSSSSWSREQAIDEIDELTRDTRLIEAAGIGDSGAAVPFTVDIRRSVQSWGADAAAEEIVVRLMEWAAQGVVGTAAYAAVTGLLRRFAKSSTDATFRREALDRDEAFNLAQWGVAEKFGLPPPVQWVERPARSGEWTEIHDTSVGLVDELHEEGRFVFRFRRAPFEYSVTVELVEGLCVLAHYRRTRIA